MNQVKSKDSNSKQGSELLEAVGGLEAAQKIVDGAPEGATHCFFDSSADDEKGIWYYKDNGNQSFDSGRWSFAYDPQFPRKLDDRLIKLSDIRAELLARPKFKVGDLVVFTDDFMHGEIMTVSGFFQNEVEMDSGSKRVHMLEMLRHATPEEIAVGHRIVDPVYGKSTSDELGQNPICIEEEPLNLFQSKHCSPRGLTPEPTASEAIMNFMVMPANRQPYCSACTTKDHDLKALRKLQASNISIYAGRVHSQQTQIMLREIIICVLVIAWIGLFLWGLK